MSKSEEQYMIDAEWEQDVEMLNLEQLKNEIETSWYRHLELRTEVYEMDMGPSDILDIYVSWQKRARLSMSSKHLYALMQSNFNYHVALRNRYYDLMNIKGCEKKFSI